MFTLTFDTANADFVLDDGTLDRHAIEAAARRVLESLVGGRDGGSVRDGNGNSVGEWELVS